MTSRQSRVRPVRVLQYTILAVALVAALGPTVWAVMTSFRPTRDIVGRIVGLPIPPTLAGYRDAFATIDLGLHLLNQFAYAFCTATLVTVVALLLAYPCARMMFPLRRTLTVAITSALAVPVVSLVTPEFYIMFRLGLYDTRHGLVIFYVATYIPLTFVLLRAYLTSLPRDIEEAAAIDGASYWRTLFSVVVPVVAPVLITVYILAFVFTWNDFLWNLLFAPSREHRNAQVALAEFQGEWDVNISGLLAAATIIALVPVTIFLLTQRYALAGLTGSAATRGGRRRPAPDQDNPEAT